MPGVAEIFMQENAIVLAVSEKFVTLGQKAAQRIINGMTPETQDEKAEQILVLLTAYRNKNYLNDDNLESLLYAMRLLSGANVFPPTEPIIGQANNYIITGGTSGGGGASGDPRPAFDAYNAASGNPPVAGSGSAGAILKGDQFYAQTGSSVYGDLIGTVFGVEIHHGCVFTAKVNGAGNNRNEWYLSEYGF